MKKEKDFIIKQVIFLLMKLVFQVLDQDVKDD